jgi:hypothetical protein
MLTIYFGGVGSSAIVSVGVFYVWPKTTRLLPMWPREAKRLDSPGLDNVGSSTFQRGQGCIPTLPGGTETGRCSDPDSK